MSEQFVFFPDLKTALELAYQVRMQSLITCPIEEVQQRRGELTGIQQALFIAQDLMEIGKGEENG